MFYVGFVGTLFAYAIWRKLLKDYTAATVTPFALLIPASGIITAHIILSEKLDSVEIVGTAVVMLGLILYVLANHGNQITLKMVYNKAFQRTANRR